MYSIEIEGLDKYYGKFKALDSINMNIRPGEALGFLGPNGAGKTTTIRILLGLLKKSKGNIKVLGHDPWNDSVKVQKNLAYVPGDVHLWPNLTGGEIIDFFINLRGKVDKVRRDELIKRFELDPRKKCSTYSKGNRQKVGLISAFASDVDLYILDEPTSGLDPLMSSVFQEMVKELKSQGKTILMSSHILDDVDKLCDRVSIIREGRIVETKSINDLKHMSILNIEVETDRKINNLLQFTTTSDINIRENYASFSIESSELNQVMSHLTSFGIKKITSTPPSLESIFMSHYGDESEGGIKVEKK